MKDINYTVTDNNIHIEDSYKLTKKTFKNLLNEIKKEYPLNKVLNIRNLCSLKLEWMTHKFLYKIKYQINRTKDVDLDIMETPKRLFGYHVIGALTWIFFR